MSATWKRLRLFVGILWLALLVVMLVPVVVSHLAPRTGRSVFIIRGASMTPAIPLGSLIVDVPVDPSTIAVGDIVTIRGDNKVVYTHRVVNITTETAERHFVLKGDANDAPDGGLVPARSIVGRVESFAPVAGYLLALLSTPSGVLSAMSMLGSLLLTYWLLEEIEHDEQTEAEQKVSPGSIPAAA